MTSVSSRTWSLRSMHPLMFKIAISATVVTQAMTLATSTLASNSAMGHNKPNMLRMELQSNKVVIKPNGVVDYIPVSTAEPGTVIQYKALYTNKSKKNISDVMVTLPIPTNTVFTGEVYPPSAQATIDGKNYSDMPIMRRENGQLVQVPYDEYEGLRWTIKLLPAQKTTYVSLNAVVQ